MKAKKFSTNMYKSDLESFKSHIKKESTDQFIKEYIASNKQTNVSSKEDVFSLMLNTSLVLDDSELVGYILSLNLGNNILVNIDDLGRSPIARVLAYGDEELLSQVSKYIKAQGDSAASKSNLPEEDLPNIVKALEYPRLDSFDLDKYLDDYLRPLYTESDCQQLQSLGEVIE